MPTFEWTARFDRDFADLRAADPALADRFRGAVREFVVDLTAGRPPRPGLRVKSVQGAAAGVMELTFASDGRATWQYGPEQVSGTPHIIWRRVGKHEIFNSP